MDNARKLTQAQLDTMDGDRGTLIPFDLEYPDHWPDPPLLDSENVATASDDEAAAKSTQNVKHKIVSSHPSLNFASHSVLEQIAQFRESVRGNNHLAIECPDFQTDLLGFLDRLSGELTILLDGLPAPQEEMSEDEAEEAMRWGDRFRDTLVIEADAYLAPEALAKTTVPAGLIFGLGTIGALIGGPLGFGAGALAGKLLVGHAKPGDAAKRIEDHMKEDTPDAK
ncbi:MAG: hypothetical protein AAFR17_05755 [Pseudomonadota bacterium]